MTDDVQKYIEMGFNEKKRTGETLKTFLLNDKTEGNSSL